MIFETKRLIIRELSSTDVYSIHELHSLPQTDEFNTLGIPETIETTKQLVSEKMKSQDELPRICYFFCIELIDTKQFIGLIGLNVGKQNYRTAEIWYKIHLKHWGNGYATEAVSNLLKFGFKDLGLHRIEAGCAVENIASAKVLEKVGMIKEGMKRKKLPIRGEWKDNYFYAILEEDFEDYHYV